MCLSGCTENPKGNDTGTTTQQRDIPDPNNLPENSAMAWYGDNGVVIRCGDDSTPEVRVNQGGGQGEGWIDLPSGAGGGISGGGSGSGLQARCGGN